MTKSTRKFIATLAVVIGLTLYALAVVLLFTALPRMPVLLELLAYAIAGIVWIFPCYRLLVWVETGAWTVNRDAAR
jgi:hypothetical protein